MLPGPVGLRDDQRVFPGRGGRESRGQDHRRRLGQRQIVGVAPSARTTSRRRCATTGAQDVLLAAAASVLDFIVAPAHAQANLNIETPAMRQLTQSMEARHAQLKKYYDAGAIGLTRDGLVQVRDQNLVPLPERNAVRKLVAEENADRTNLYREIATANGHPNGRPTSARRSPSAGPARRRPAGTSRTKVAPGSKNELPLYKKRAPRFAGLFVSRPTISSSCWVARLKRKRCSCRSNPSSPNAGFERSSGASLTLCFRSFIPFAVAIPASLPRNRQSRSDCDCIQEEQVACLRHSARLQTRTYAAVWRACHGSAGVKVAAL